MIVVDFPGFSSRSQRTMLVLLQRTPVSILNLSSQPARTIASVLGVAFALLLIFMQLGFRGAVGNTATIVYGKLKGDLILRSPEYVHLYEPRMIARSWMNLAEGFEDVERIDPFYILLHRWQNPPKNPECTQLPPDGSFRTVGLMAMQIDRPVFDVPGVLNQEHLDRLKDPNAMLIDSATRSEYGPHNCRCFSDDDLDKVTDLGGKNTRIAGVFRIGTGLATNGAVLVSDVAFGMRTGIDVSRTASFGLVTLKQGVAPEQARDALVRYLAEREPDAGSEVEILTMKEQMQWERRRWLTETPIGMIFTMGVLLSFLIGAAIVYMVLATDVASRLPEYATLKAMGYSPVYLARIVLSQAWLLALFGYVPAFLLAVSLYEITATLSGIPTFMTIRRGVGVFGLSYLMCTMAGLLAIRKLWKADPVSLF